MQQLKLSQKLLQKLSPQQILLMKLLQVPSVALDQRIKQEIEENPALEDLENESTSDEISNEDNDSDERDDNGSDDEFDLSDYMSDDDTPDYKTYSNNYPEEDKKSMPFANTISFYEHNWAMRVLMSVTKLLQKPSLEILMIPVIWKETSSRW